MKKIAFTLFEALIVMTILGIIATIMVTSIKPQEYKEKALAAAAKKVMNEVDHATSMILMNDSLDGTMYNLVATDGTTFSIEDTSNLAKSTKLGELYKKYLVTSRKECIDDNCRCYKLETGDTKPYSYRFYLKDGACMSVEVGYAQSNTFFPGETNLVAMNRYARVLFDVNDNEEPNILGKDYFNIPLGKEGIMWNNDNLPSAP